MSSISNVTRVKAQAFGDLKNYNLSILRILKASASPPQTDLLRGLTSKYDIRYGLGLR